MATAAGVSVDWLATGRMRRPTGQPPAADTTSSDGSDAVEGQQEPLLETVVLEGILKAVLEARGDYATPEHLAALTLDLYQRAMGAGPP